MLAAGAAGIYFWFGGNAALKRRVYPWYAMATGLVFLGVVVALNPTGLTRYALLPLVVIVTFVNVRTTTFCAQCARLISRAPGSPVRECPRCGAAIPEV